MTKWAQYRRVQVVDVMFFERPADPGNPPYPIQLDPCACDAMDGYTCGQHRRTPSYSYHYRAIDRHVSIRPGEYLVRFADGRAMTASPQDFGEHYEPLVSVRDALP